MGLTWKISPHVADIIDPMCSETAKLLREHHFKDGDHVEISIEDAFEEVATSVDSRGVDVTATTKRFIVRFCNDKYTRPSFAMMSGWWQSIPGSALLDSESIKCPPTDVSALVLLAALGPQRIKFYDEDARIEFWRHVLRFRKQTRVARAQAGYKSYKTVPNDAPKGRPGMPPMPHQAVAAWCGQRSEAYALYMEQSTGKTYATLLTIEPQIKPDECPIVLIIAPKNVCAQWAQQIKEFSSKRNAVYRFRGLKMDRTKTFLEALRMQRSGDVDVVYVIAPYQTYVNSMTQLLAVEWDWGVLDEGHFIKWPGTQRAKAAMRLRDRCKRRLILTGTPIANQVFDLYAQLEFLGRGWSGFTTFKDFRNFHGTWEVAGRGVERLVALQNIPLLQERLARCSFLIKKVDAMPDLPAKTYDMLTVEMTSEQRTAYDTLANQLYLEIEADLAAADRGEKRVTADNILVRLLRLAQITSGFVALDQTVDPETDKLLPRQIDRFDPNPKLEELVAFIKAQDCLSKTIVWCCFVPDIKQVAARLQLEGIGVVTYYGHTSEDERDAAVKAFNEDSKTTVFIGNPSAGGVGLNLTGTCKATWPMRCDTVVPYSQNFSAVTRAQGEERPRGFLHESVSPTGKRESWSIRVVDICVEDSIDMQIRERVVNKRLNAAKIQDIRDLLRSLVGTRLEVELEEDGDE